MEDTHSYLYNFGGVEDHGYFAIFDGHAGKQAADWCGTRVHQVLDEVIRKNPGTPIPDLLDQTYMQCDGALAALSQRNSGCTAVTALMLWEQREEEKRRVLYTANVGDARIVLCRKGMALRLSYDHKGSDENEGKRVADAGGLILNNRVNGEDLMESMLTSRCSCGHASPRRFVHEGTDHGTSIHNRNSPHT